MSEKRCYTVQASYLAKVSRSMINKWADKGKFTVIKVGSRVRIRRDEFEDWMEQRDFQNMIKDIESGLINCVITKDLSRLGRNYLDCGLYLEVFFPEHNVRYIAVNDGVGNQDLL